MWDTIGENAGKIWQVLDEQGPASPTKLAKQLKVKVSDVDRAIGWLAREDKLSFETLSNGGVRVGLKSS